MKKLAALLVVSALALTGCSAMNQQEQICTIKDKEAVRSGDGNPYRVYTEECGTLAVQDSLSQMRFDSADLYGSLERGETYRFFTGSYRVGPLSMFPNILEAERID